MGLAAACLLLACAAEFWPAQPVHAIEAPQGVTVLFGESAATIVWTEVPGSQGYGVTIRPIGIHGPFGQEQVLGDRWTVPYTAFPDYGTHKTGYTFEVCAISVRHHQACKAINRTFYVKSRGAGVSTSNLRKAAQKVSACLGKGEKAALVEAAANGTVVAVASWIPGVDAVTAAEVAAASAGEGAATFAACLVDW